MFRGGGGRTRLVVRDLSASLQPPNSAKNGWECWTGAGTSRTADT